jgi:hypothetical protein
MLFKLLKLFGLDVHAEVAAVKGEITRRVDDVTNRARQLALGAAVIAVLAMFAGLFFVTAIGIGLLALYRFAEAAYGADFALAILAAVLVGVILILLGVALLVARSLKSARPAAVEEDVANTSANAAAQPEPPRKAGAQPLISSGDLVEPLTLVLGLFGKDPKLGHPALDEFVTACRMAASRTKRSSGPSMSSATATGATFPSSWAPPSRQAGCWPAGARCRAAPRLHAAPPRAIRSKFGHVRDRAR